MSSKVQMNCSFNQRMRQSDFKYLRKYLNNNIKRIEELEEQINQLKQATQINMSIADPYHPNNEKYINKENLIIELQLENENYRFWIRIITS